MRIALVVLLCLHAGIHLLGFAKAFGLAEIPALRHAIGPAAGILWLAAALLLLGSAVLVARSDGRWWVVAGVGVLLSQTLIAGAWQDARFGTLANVLIAIPVLLALADRRPGSLRSSYRSEVRRLTTASPSSAPALVTDSDLASLPPLIRGYLTRAGVVGRPRVVNFRAVFRADMRNGRESPWMSATVEQYNFFGPNARLFFMSAARRGVPFDAFHRYVGNEASFTVRLAGVVPMIQANGPVMTRSETVTLFNDMCILAPATLLDPAIEWSALDASHVGATFTNAGHRIAAVLTFDAAGDLVNFRSDDRHQYDGTIDRLLPWLTPVTDYRDFGGVRLAARGEARWLEAESEWTYGRFDLQRIEYNVRGP